jgi:hypothetical protein
MLISGALLHPVRSADPLIQRLKRKENLVSGVTL